MLAFTLPDFLDSPETMHCFHLYDRGSAQEFSNVDHNCPAPPKLLTKRESDGPPVNTQCRSGNTCAQK